MTNTNNPAAGWYPDPQNPMSQRYWDGATWTDQTRPVMPSSPVPPPPHSGLPAGVPVGQRPDNYLMWSILATVCCCIPLGIPAIVNAAKVDGAWSRGDVAGAMHHSAQAKKFAIIAAAVGGVLGVLSFGVQFLAAFASS